MEVLRLWPEEGEVPADLPPKCEWRIRVLLQAGVWTGQPGLQGHRCKISSWIFNPPIPPSLILSPPTPLLQVEYPDYWTHESWCEGFTKFIDHLNLDKVSFLLAQVSNWEPPPTRSLSPSRSTSSGLPWVAIWHRYSRSTRACGSSPSFSATPLLTRETLPRTRLSLDCIAPPPHLSPHPPHQDFY